MVWSCPECEASTVCSVREWREVFKWRTHLKRDHPRMLDTLTQAGWEPKPGENGKEMVRRWADDDRHYNNPDDGRPTPTYICASCRRVYPSVEVSG